MKHARTALLAILASMPLTANAVLSMDQMLVNLQVVVRPVYGMLLTISLVLGILMMMRGIILLKSLAVPPTQMSRPGEIMGPIVYIFVGSILIWIPAASDTLSLTLFATTQESINGIANNSTISASKTLLIYTNAGVEQQWSRLIDTIVTYVKLIGFIAFLRGWLIISEIGQQGSQPGHVTKGIVHIIGGILAINFIPLAMMIQNTLTTGGS
jgi:intracellular multiplication protein IcmC